MCSHCTNPYFLSGITGRQGRLLDRINTSSVGFAATCLAAARARLGSDMPPAYHSLPSHRFATLKGKANSWVCSHRTNPLFVGDSGRQATRSVGLDVRPLQDVRKYHRHSIAQHFQKNNPQNARYYKILWRTCRFFQKVFHILPV